MKILSVTVPCYNSQDYMEHCISTLLSGGNDIEIIIVDDGSKDNTAQIADLLASEHPEIISVIHQENAGHGGAVMTGLKHAKGTYFRVVDSDDWVDEKALKAVLAKLRQFAQMDNPIDLLVTNYVYDKVGEKRKKVIRYKSALPENAVLSWDDIGKFHKWEYMLMHAMTYRTQVIRDSGLVLPKHTFYVDNLYATVPLVQVKTLYYMNVDLYHYFIGRDDQSIHETIMIQRIDQQIRVNKLLMEEIDLEHVENCRQQKTILNYHDIITAVSSILLIIAGTPEHLKMKEELWRYIKEEHPWEYQKLRYDIMGVFLHLPGKFGRMTCIGIYKVLNLVFHFN